jgi:hypothetical protein
MIQWLLHWFGLDDASGPIYSFWSGFGSDIPIFAAITAFYWHHSCHVSRCWRLGRHGVNGTDFKVCRKHHPTIPNHVTADHVTEAHNLSQS